MLKNPGRTYWIVALSLALLSPAHSDPRRSDELKFDLTKAIGSFWDPPSYDDPAVEIDSFEMQQNPDCASQALKEVSANLKARWATNMYKKAAFMTIKAVSSPLKASGIDVSKAIDVAQIVLSADSVDDLKEQLTKRLGEEAVKKLVGAKGEKVFDELFDHYLPPQNPFQTKSTQHGTTCMLDVQFTLTPPAKGKKANLRLDVDATRCIPATAEAPQAQPSSYHLAAQGDLVPDAVRGSTLSYKLASKHYTLTGECGKFPPPAGLQGSGHFPFKTVLVTTGSKAKHDYFSAKLSVSPGYSFHFPNLTIVTFEGAEETAKYFKFERVAGDLENEHDLTHYTEESVQEIRVQFDRGAKQAIHRDHFEAAHATFQIPAGAQKLIGLEMDILVGGQTKTWRWSAKELKVPPTPH